MRWQNFKPNTDAICQAFRCKIAQDPNYDNMSDTKVAQEIGINRDDWRILQVETDVSYSRSTFVKIGQFLEVPWESLVAEAAFEASAYSVIGSILKLTATLLAQGVSKEGSIRSFCHLHEEFEKSEFELGPIARYLGSRASTDAYLCVPCPTDKKQDQVEYVIVQAFRCRDFVCDNAKWDPQEAVGKHSMVAKELKAVAAYPIVPINGSNGDKPLGTVCFDVDQTIEDLGWDNGSNRAFLESTLAELADVVHRILSPPKRRKRNANGKS